MKRVPTTLTILALVLLGGSVLPALAQDTLAARLERAVEQARARRCTDAIRTLVTVVRQDSTQAPAWALMGLCQNRLSRFTEARDALEVARGLEPWRTRYAWELGHAYVGLEEWARAEAQYREAREAYPDSATLSMQLARTLLRQGKGAEARVELDRAERQNFLFLPYTRLYRIESYRVEGDQAAVAREARAYREIFGPGGLTNVARRYVADPVIRAIGQADAVNAAVPEPTSARRAAAETGRY